MAKILEMPKLSPTMEEGVLSAWHKKEGDAIAVDDLLAEVETDKATMEFRSFDKGTLLKILVPRRLQVKLGQPVAIIGEAGRRRQRPRRPGGQRRAGSACRRARRRRRRPRRRLLPLRRARPLPRRPRLPRRPLRRPRPPVAQRKPPVVNALERTSFPGQTSPDGGGEGPDGVASWRRRTCARWRARGHRPQGRAGKRTARPTRARRTSTSHDDAELAALRARSCARRPRRRRARARGARGAPAAPMRKTIARRLTESKATVPHFYLTIDVDVGGAREAAGADQRRARAQGGRLERRPRRPTKVSVNDLLIKACARRARARARVQRELHARRHPGPQARRHLRGRRDPRRARDPGRAQRRPEERRRRSRGRCASSPRARAARKLKPEEMADGTFSISNLGMFGIDEFAAVINPPEGAILAVGQVRDVPVVRERRGRRRQAAGA